MKGKSPRCQEKRILYLLREGARSSSAIISQGGVNGIFDPCLILEKLQHAGKKL